MRILFVSHNVPPHGTAGTETYTAELARALARRGHAVMVFAALKDIRRREGRVLAREAQGVAIREIVNNLYHANLRGTWHNPRVERAFAAVLREHRPEVVHVQHLLYLSAGCLRLAREAGARVVFTLHDYWLTCARLGQRVHADGAVCHTVDFARCGTCLVSHAWTQPRAARVVGPWIAALHEVTGLDLSGAARRARSALEPAAARASPPAPAPEERAASATTRGDAPEGAHGATAEAPAPLAPGSEPAPASAAASALARAAEERARALRAEVGGAVDLFLAPSRFLRERFLAEWGLDPARIEHLPFGFDRARFGGARRPSPDGRFRVGFLGTLVPLKGPHVLLEAWSQIPAGLRARARLVVHGPARGGQAYHEHLLGLARAAGAELPGPLTRDEVGPFLLATDLLVVPSLWFENSPLAIQEAIACRTPLAASDLGGMRELVVPGENGLLFPAGDVAALARHLADAIAGRAGLERCYANAPALLDFEEHVDRVLARYARGARP
ncbi:MAG: glycosyltransferase [Planctomycetes bacterium]|nr:glycosyltransferase [Planctomycetota bacterium]